MLEALFWLSVLLGVYPYAVYPVLVRLAAIVLQRPVGGAATHMPRITVITAAFNEAAHIEATVRNKLSQHYP
ncbi:MAG: glycosyltransferase family 2 protein, partial [Steroidobacteraceae bacterium]